jgi:hypothetical protein
MKLHYVIACEVSGENRYYHAIDTGEPWKQMVFTDSSERQEIGGLSVHRGDKHYHPELGNGWVGQFQELDSVLEFIKCLRGRNIEVIAYEIL